LTASGGFPTRRGDGGVYLTDAILLVQQEFGKLSGFDSASLLESLGDAATIAAAAEILHLMDAVPAEQVPYLRDFLASIPPAIDAATVAAIRNALGRGLRTAFSWQPGYDFELRIWDVSKDDGPEKGWAGLVNVQLVSPHPPEATPAS
jgi:hypothetical protein